MPNLIKSGTTITAGTIKRFNFLLGVDTTVQYSQAEISQFYFTIVPPANGYAVYEQKAVQGPSIRIAQNDSDFITISQQYSQNKNIASANEGLSYFNNVQQYMVTNLDYPYISTSGLTVLLDAGFTPSYCRTGANWNDLSGNDYSAILYNSPTFSLNSGGVFVLNGTNNFASGSIPSMSNFSFGAWVNITSIVNNAGLVSPSVGGLGMYINGASQAFQFFNAVATGNTIIPNTWYYVVGTQDNTTQRLYINGSLVSSATSNTTISGTYYVGKRNDDVYLNANIGAIQIYNRALNATEILSGYTAQNPRYFTVTLTPTTTPTQTPTVTPTPSITATQTQTPTNTITQTQTPTPSITASQTQTPTPSITASQTQTPTNTITQTQTPTPSITASQTQTPTNTITQTQTPTPSITASQTQTPTNTITQTQTPTPSITASQTQTPTPSITASQTQTPTPSITASQTQTPTPSITASQTPTPSITASQTQTPTPSITASQTQTPTNTITQTQTPTPSITASQTQTPTQTITRTQTPTPSITASQTPTPSITASQTQTPTPSITASQTPTPSITASQTQTPTQTITRTQTPTPSITASQTPTPSITASPTQTPTPSITASRTPTPSITASQTQTPTPSITASQTPTPSITASPTQTPTPSITASQTATQTPTLTPTLTPTGALSTICVGGTNGTPYVLMNGPDNNFFMGGAWTQYSGVTANYIIKANENGYLNSTFSTGTGFNSSTYAIGPASGSKVFVGGDSISSYNGTSTGPIVKLNSNGTIDTSFTASAIGDQYTSKRVLGLIEFSNGKLLAVGDFAYYGVNLATNGMVLNADGSFNVNLDTNTNGYTRSAALQLDNKIIAVGIGGSTVERVSSGGTKDTTFNSNHGTFSGYLPGSQSNLPEAYDVAIQSDGKIVVVGDFQTVNGYSRNGIVRLNSDGTVDTGFNPGTAFDRVPRVLRIQSDGKIVVGGGFTSYNGNSSNYIVRINSNGTYDSSFSVGTGFNGTVFALTIIRSNIYCGGAFTTYNGMDTTVIGDYVAVLDTNGGIVNCPNLTPTPTPTQTQTPTNTSTQTPTQTPTSTPPSNYYVTANTYTPRAMTCSQYYTFAAATDYNVDTSLNVEITWYGDLGGYAAGTVTISTGNSCNTTSVNSSTTINCLGENYSYVSVILDPSSYGNQIYQVGTDSPIGSSPC